MWELFYWRNVVIWFLLNMIFVGVIFTSKFIWHDVMGYGTQEVVKLSQR